MPKAFIERCVPYSRDVLFDIIADVESYPQFVPWCKAARVVKQINKDCFSAEMVIGFQGIRESYVSRVTLDRKAFTVNSVAESRLFHRLINNWRLLPADAIAAGESSAGESLRKSSGKKGLKQGASCQVQCHLDYDFRSRLLSGVASMFFNYVTTHIVEAFEERARVRAQK